MLTNSDIADLVEFRRDLHRFPEISGEESETAERISTVMSSLGADELITGLGGHGVAAVFNGLNPGPTVLFRCELDALPIAEESEHSYRSTLSGKGHLCGHDGHMAILTGLARLLSRQRPVKGRVVLMFQPAEETGAGAIAVIEDKKFDPITPEFSFSLHNLPGLPLGYITLASGPACCASRGLYLKLKGKEAHASNPATGISPMPALATLMPALSKLSHGAPQDSDFTLVTVTHAQMGAPAFGIAPGEATLFATLRTQVDTEMKALMVKAEALISAAAETYHLDHSIHYEDVFHHCENHPEATSILQAAMDVLNMSHDAGCLPQRFSEDFGRFGTISKAAMLFLGAGEGHPALHNPDYDFPDDLIAPAAHLFHQVTCDLLG